MNKSTGGDKKYFNLMNNCFGELSDILRYALDLSLQIGIFIDHLKVAKMNTFH